LDVQATEPRSVERSNRMPPLNYFSDQNYRHSRWIVYGIFRFGFANPKLPPTARARNEESKQKK
jgi:hypothetical protein